MLIQSRLLARIMVRDGLVPQGIGANETRVSAMLAEGKESWMVTQEKRALTMADIDAQTALELPDRELMALVNIAVFDILNNNIVNIPITVQNNHVAAQVCAQVNALTTTPLGYHFSCTVSA